MNFERTVLEKHIEDEVTDFAEIRGWWQCKFTSPQLRGVMDRLFIRRGKVIFIEFKKPGEEPTAQQNKRMREMKSHGAEIYWIDNIEDARRILQ